MSPQPKRDAIIWHPIGDSYCLHNRETGFLAIANETAKLIAQLANSGSNETEIAQQLAAQHDAKPADLVPFVRDTLSAILDEGYAGVLPPALGKSDKVSATHCANYLLPNDHRVTFRAQSHEVFSVVDDLLESYRMNAAQGSEPETEGNDHSIVCMHGSDGQAVYVDGKVTAFEATTPFAKRFVLEQFLCLALLPDIPSAILHASAVNLNGKTVVLVGNSGAGKSTLAAYLASQGGAIVSDDLMGLSPDGQAVSSFHSKSNLKAGSWAVLRRALPELEQVVTRKINRFGQNTETKFLNLATPGQLQKWQSVALVIHVEWGEHGTCQSGPLAAEVNFERLFLTGSTVRTFAGMEPEAMVRFATQVPAHTLEYAHLPDAHSEILRLLGEV